MVVLVVEEEVEEEEEEEEMVAEAATVPSATAAVLSRANNPQSAAAASGVETSRFLPHAVYRANARRRRGLGVVGRIRLDEEVERQLLCALGPLSLIRPLFPL